MLALFHELVMVMVMMVMVVIIIGLVGVTHSFYAGGNRLMSSSQYHTGTTVSLVYDAKRVSGGEGEVKSYRGPWIYCVERWKKTGSYRLPSLVLLSSISSSSSTTTVASESMVTPFHSNSTTSTTTTTDSASIGRNTAVASAAPHYHDAPPSKLLQSVIEAYHRKDISLFIGLLKDCAAKNHRMDILPSIAYPRLQALLDDSGGIDHDACRLSDSIICDMLWIIGR